MSEQNNQIKLFQKTYVQQFHKDPLTILYNKINNHLLFHFVSLVQFWTSNRLCVTIQQFQEMMFKISFFKGAEQLKQITENNKIQFITLDNLLQGVNQWKKQNIDIVTFLQRQKKYKEQNIQVKQISKIKSKQSNLVQNKSSTTNRSIKSNSSNSKANYENRTKQYIAKKAQKQKQALINLNNNLIRTKNQSHYQLTIKIGQLNDICKKLKNNMTFLLITKDNGQIIIIEKSQKSGTQKNISEKMFQKYYEDFKIKSNNQIQQIQGTLQKDLRQTLVEVMFLSDQVEKQIQLLKRKGVNA